MAVTIGFSVAPREGTLPHWDTQALVTVHIRGERAEGAAETSVLETLEFYRMEGNEPDPDNDTLLQAVTQSNVRLGLDVNYTFKPLELTMKREGEEYRHFYARYTRFGIDSNAPPGFGGFTSPDDALEFVTNIRNLLGFGVLVWTAYNIWDDFKNWNRGGLIGMPQPTFREKWNILWVMLTRIGSGIGRTFLPFGGRRGWLNRMLRFLAVGALSLFLWDSFAPTFSPTTSYYMSPVLILRWPRPDVTLIPPQTSRPLQIGGAPYRLNVGPSSGPGGEGRSNLYYQIKRYEGPLPTRLPPISAVPQLDVRHVWRPGLTGPGALPHVDMTPPHPTAPQPDNWFAEAYLKERNERAYRTDENDHSDFGEFPVAVSLIHQFRWHQAVVELSADRSQVGPNGWIPLTEPILLSPRVTNGPGQIWLEYQVRSVPRGSGQPVWVPVLANRVNNTSDQRHSRRQNSRASYCVQLFDTQQGGKVLATSNVVTGVWHSNVTLQASNTAPTADESVRLTVRGENTPHAGRFLVQYNDASGNWVTVPGQPEGGVQNNFHVTVSAPGAGIDSRNYRAAMWADEDELRAGRTELLTSPVVFVEWAKEYDVLLVASDTTPERGEAITLTATPVHRPPGEEHWQPVPESEVYYYEFSFLLAGETLWSFIHFPIGGRRGRSRTLTPAGTVANRRQTGVIGYRVQMYAAASGGDPIATANTIVRWPAPEVETPSGSTLRVGLHADDYNPPANRDVRLSVEIEGQTADGRGPTADYIFQYQESADGNVWTDLVGRTVSRSWTVDGEGKAGITRFYHVNLYLPESRDRILTAAQAAPVRWQGIRALLPSALLTVSPLNPGANVDLTLTGTFHRGGTGATPTAYYFQVSNTGNADDWRDVGGNTDNRASNAVHYEGQGHASETKYFRVLVEYTLNRAEESVVSPPVAVTWGAAGPPSTIIGPGSLTAWFALYRSVSPPERRYIPTDRPDDRHWRLPYGWTPDAGEHLVLAVHMLISAANLEEDATGETEAGFRMVSEAIPRWGRRYVTRSRRFGFRVDILAVGERSGLSDDENDEHWTYTVSPENIRGAPIRNQLTPPPRPADGRDTVWEFTVDDAIATGLPVVVCTLTWFDATPLAWVLQVPDQAVVGGTEFDWLLPGATGGTPPYTYELWRNLDLPGATHEITTGADAVDSSSLGRVYGTAQRDVTGGYVYMMRCVDSAGTEIWQSFVINQTLAPDLLV